MDKHLRDAKRLSMCTFLFLFLVLSAAANSFNSISKEELRSRIESLSSQIELRYSDEVHTLINTYIQKQRNSSEIILARGQVYFPLYDSQLANEGLPIELKYLSVVESSLRPQAVSSMGAVGLWQFMPGTAKIYGLNINSVVDERRDPVRSTQAASAYLRDLYQEFGDWTLAVAAYNCGPGALRRALRKSDQETFWNVRGYLPRETRRYIPKYIAISYLMNYHMYHDLMPMSSETSINRLATARIYDHLTFSRISEYTGLTNEEVSDLNPAYLKGYIPKRSEGYNLTLPEQDLYKLLFDLAIQHDLVYTPQSSHHLELAYMQRDMKSRLSQVYSVEVLPTVEADYKVISKDIVQNPSQMPPSKYVAYQKPRALDHNRYHRLEKNQSLVDIAELYDINISRIIDLNDFSTTAAPLIGSYVQIRE